MTDDQQMIMELETLQSVIHSPHLGRALDHLKDTALQDASQDMLGALQKVFILLNLYATNPWGGDPETGESLGHGDGPNSVHSPHGILGQVYGDLAAHFAAFKTAVEVEGGVTLSQEFLDDMRDVKYGINQP